MGCEARLRGRERSYVFKDHQPSMRLALHADGMNMLPGRAAPSQLPRAGGWGNQVSPPPCLPAAGGVGEPGSPKFTSAVHAARAAQRRDENKIVPGRAAPSQTLPGAGAWVRGPEARVR